MGNNIAVNNKIPQFIAQVTIPDQTSPVSLYVQSFTLKKTVNSMIQCSIRAASGVSLFQTTDVKIADEVKKQNIKYQDGVRLFKASLTSNKLLPCVLKTKGKNSVCYFKGYVLVVAPSLSTNQIKTQAALTLSCIGQQYHLMLQPGKDYNWVPANQLLTVQTITKAVRGYFNKSVAGDPLGSNSNTSIIANAGLRSQHDVATIVALLDKQARGSKDIKTNQTTQNAPDLSNFIESKYSLGPSIQKLSESFAKNPYIQDICRAYISGITQNTIWNGLLQAFCTDKLLQLIPPSIQATNKQSDSYLKYQVRPVAYKTDIQYSITANEIINVYLSADLRKQLAIPDHLAVAFNLAKYVGFGYIKQPVSYGIYPKLSTNTNQKTESTKIRVLQAPSWLQYGDVEKYTYKNQRISTPTADASVDGKAEVQVPVRVQKDNSLRTAYTRLLFFRLYQANKNLQVTMPFSQYTKDIDKYLGSPVCIDLTDTNTGSSTNSWESLSDLIGVVNSVSYQFFAADGVGNTNSSFVINVELNMITSKGSQYAKAFTQQSSDIYRKIEKN